MTVQYIISSGIYLYTGGSLTDLTVRVQMERFKYGEWQNDVLLEALPNMIGLLMLLSYIYTCINTVKSITIEKERQLKVRLIKYTYMYITTMKTVFTSFFLHF